jgi:hypothetical protein
MFIQCTHTFAVIGDLLIIYEDLLIQFLEIIYYHRYLTMKIIRCIHSIATKSYLTD